MPKQEYGVGQWVIMQETGDPAKIACVYPGEFPRMDAWVVTETDHEGEVVRLERGLFVSYILRLVDDPAIVESLERIKSSFEVIRKGVGNDRNSPEDR